MCVQVLTPMRKGPAGVQSLNGRLQALLNPPEKGKGEIRVSSAADTPQILRVGDRVIQVGCVLHTVVTVTMWSVAAEAMTGLLLASTCSSNNAQKLCAGQALLTFIPSGVLEC